MTPTSSGQTVLKGAKASLSLLAFTALLYACPAATPSDGPGGESQLHYQGKNYELKNGMVRLGSESGFHFRTTLDVAEGAYYPYTYFAGDYWLTGWRLEDSSQADISAKLYTAGSTFAAGDYPHIASSDDDPAPSLQGQNYFEEGSVTLKLNGVDETFEVKGGSITVAAKERGMSVAFDLMLENGASVRAFYGGEFIDPDNPEATYPGPGGTQPELPRESGGCAFVLDDIEAPAVLSDTEAECDYLIDSFVEVRSKLTIEPGVTLRAKEDALLSVEKGELSALGTQAQPITFEGLESSQGYWRGVHFDSARASHLQHVTIRDAGQEGCSRCKAAALSAEGTQLSLNNVSVSNSYVNGVYIGGQGDLLSFTSNQFFGNAGVGLTVQSAELIPALDPASDYLGRQQANGSPYVRVLASDLEDQLVRVWPQLNAPYFFEDSVNLRRGGLQLEPGVTLVMGTGEELKVTDEAAFSAVGSADLPITFQGEKDEQANWQGLYFSASTDNVIEHVRITDADWGVYLDGGAAASVNDSFIEANYGIYCDTGTSGSIDNTVTLGANVTFDVTEFGLDDMCRVQQP